MKKITSRLRSKWFTIVFGQYWLSILLLLNPQIVLANLQEQADTLILVNRGKTIENRLEMILPKRQQSQIKMINGKKVYLHDLQVIWNGDSALAKEVHTRGQSTLNFLRKSYSITFDKKARIERGGSIKKMKRVYALSLAMDKNYISNRLAFGLMEKVRLAGLFFVYGEIRLNNSSEGIYLFMERPQDWAFNQKSPFIIRRGYEQKISNLYTVKDLDKTNKKSYKANYTAIYSAIGKFDGEELYYQLVKYLDLEMYMQWLAFNYFMRNGDYTDEVYFYIDPEEHRFKIMPWDYDDLFSVKPHEGNKQRNAILANKYIFSSEELLDQKVASDDYLYSLYLVQLNNVLEQLSPAIIRNELENIYSELYPFYANPEIIARSRHNQYPNSNFENLEQEMRLLYRQLINSRSLLLRK